MTNGGYRAVACLAALGACALGVASFSGSVDAAAAQAPLAADAGSDAAERRLGGCGSAERVTFDPFGPTTILERVDRWVDAGRSPAVVGVPEDALDWAARSGARAFLGLDGDRLAAVLLRHPDGTYFFAGNCAGPALTEPLRRQFGGRYDAVLTRVVGEPRSAGPDRLDAVEPAAGQV